MKQKRFPYFSFGRAEDSCAKAVKRRRERTLWHFFLASIVGCCVVVSIASSATADGRRPERWVRLSPATSPPARSYLAMTYDPASGKVVMFGGFDGTGYLNDTWTFDGITWSRVATPVAPPRRAAAQMAYDAVTQKVVLFGGTTGQGIWAIPGFGTARLCDGVGPSPRIRLRLSQVRWCSRIRMAASMCLS